MLFLIVAILVVCASVVFGIVLFKISWDPVFLYQIIVAVIVATFVFACSSFIPVQHEVSYQTEEIPLVNISLTPEKENKCYVTLDNENVYSYRYQVTDFNKVVDGSYAETAYRVDTVSGWVTEIESSECTTPTLYIRKYKNTWGVFRVGLDYTTEYVFYVPEGTIAKNIIAL